ncbi:MAG TPA: anti-sigma factor [Terriglobales bacterium]|jgi:Putative zinc-finger|nr:anti-sigma factor [Terriglobales bacterium]
MDWNCKNSEERLSEYLDGKLAPAEASAFAMHAAGCPNCAQLISQVGSLIGRMHQLEEIAEPPQLVQSILDATIGPRTQKAGWTKWFTWVPVLWQPRFAMGIITVAASLAIVLHTSGVTPGKIKRADLSPASLVRSANRQVHLTYARSAKFVNDLRVVYEIQSRLQPGPEPSPISTPMPQQQTQPPSTTPQQKSEKDPPRDRSQVQGGSMYAVLMPVNLSDGLTATLTRSFQ